MRVHAECALHPTESADKVRQALRNLFPAATITEEGGRVRGEGGDLERVRQLIHDQRIRDTARGQLLAGRQGDRLLLTLSKQAAFAGRVSFSAGSPLGDIEVKVEDADMDALIDHVAESTVGKRLTPQDQPPQRRH